MTEAALRSLSPRLYPSLCLATTAGSLVLFTDELNIPACLLMSGVATGSDARLLCLRSVCRLFFLPSAQRKGEEKKTKPKKTVVDDPDSDFSLIASFCS